MKKRKKGGNWLVIALTVLIGFGAVAGVYALTNRESEPTKKNEVVTPANTIDDIDYSLCIDGVALDTSVGSFLTTGYPTMWISGYIKAVGGKTVEFSHSPYKVCYYDVNKTFIRCDKFATAETMTKQYILPTNTAYIIFQFTEDTMYGIDTVLYESRTSVKISYME